MGYASEVWVSRPDSPVAKLEKLGIHFVGEEEYNREILIHEGVPESAVHILPAIVINTEEEVEEAAREVRRTGKSRVIIVTSPEHTRRVKALWKALADQEFYGDGTCRPCRPVRCRSLVAKHRRRFCRGARNSWTGKRAGWTSRTTARRLSLRLHVGESACNFGASQGPAKNQARKR